MTVRKSRGRPRQVDDGAVLAAAAAVIERVGPAGLTLAHVGAASGLSASTLAERFGSKRALLVAVSRAGLPAVTAAFEGASARRGPRLSALQHALASLVQGIDTPAVLANHLAFLQLDLVDPELRTIAAEHSRLVRHHVSELVRAALAHGELVPTDPRALARTIQTTYNGALVTWAVEGRGRLDRWLRREVEAVLGPHRAGAAVQVPSSS